MAEPSARGIRSGAGYRDPPEWPLPGEVWDTGNLAYVAVVWIATNREFIACLAGEGSDGWDAGDVISRMAWRAYRGGGLTRSLRAHVDGTDPVTNPTGVLTYHVRRMIGECVKESALRRVREVPTAQVPDNGSYRGFLLHTSGAVLDGYQQVIDALTDQTLHGLDTDGALPDVVRRVQARLPEIWTIFSQVAPPQVVYQVRQWPEEHRQLVLLAIFPLRLPHRAVAAYRRLAWPGQRDTVSEAATQRQISRLRAKLQQMWPPQLAPPQVRSAGSGKDCDGGEEPR
jgi:hypothetical protein